MYCPNLQWQSRVSITMMNAALNTDLHLDTRKRSADTDTSVVQPQKKSRLGGGTPQLPLVTTRGISVCLIHPRTKALTLDC